MIVQQYRKRARSTKESRHRLTKPGRSRLLAVKIRMYDNMDAAVSRGDIRGRRPEKRTTRPCAEQGRKQTPSAKNDDVEAVASATWSRTCGTNTRNMCIYTMVYSVRNWYLYILPRKPLQRQPSRTRGLRKNALKNLRQLEN